MAVSDIIFVMVFIVFVAMLLLIGTYLKNTVLANIRPMLSGSAVPILDTVTGAFSIMDYLFVFIAVGFSLGMIVLAFFVPVHPVMFFISIIVVIITLVITPAFSNIVRTMAKNDMLASSAAEYPIMSMVFSNYPVFMLVISALLLIVLFAKMQGGATE